MKSNKFVMLPLVSMLAALGSNAAFADSAVGVDTVLGNAMNPGGLDMTRSVDERGFSPVMGGKGPSHTPSGQLYQYPPIDPEWTEGENGWHRSGSIELGVVGGDANDRNAAFREYADWNNGAAITSFSLGVEKPDDARFLNVRGGGLGRKDQYFGVEYGRYNDFKFSAFYNETPHVFSTNARPVWNGVGTGNLTLPNGIKPGSVHESDQASYAALQNAAMNASTTTLEVDRKKFGLKLEGYLKENVTGFVNYTVEKREGARAFGGGFLFDFIRWEGGTPSNPGTFNPAQPFWISGGAMETVEPIDYTTHDILAGLRMVGEKDQLNLTFNGSLFVNDIKSLTWENPFAIGFPGMNVFDTNIERGRFALSPDNQAYHVKADYARSLEGIGQFTAAVSLGRMRQDESLLPPLVNSGMDFEGNDRSNWNTTAALSQQTANARIDTQMVDLGLLLKPAKDWTVRGKLRYYDENDKTRYIAYNPLTGQYGYMATDGGLSPFGGGFSGVYQEGSTNAIHYRNIPTSYSKWNATMSADYSLSGDTDVGAAYDREQTDRAHRERDRTVEDRLKLSMNTRALENGTLRLSYEYGDRHGSAYNYDPYTEFYVHPEPDGYVHTLADLRKFDLSDRTEHVVNARFNYMLRSDMDAFISLQRKLSDYKGQYGRIGDDKTDTLNLEWNYNPTPAGAFFAFYSLQKGRMGQANINDAGVGDDPNAGGAYYPSSNAWATVFHEKNHTLGAGFGQSFGKYRLESRYSYAWMRGKTRYSYASAEGATIGSGANETQSASVAGNEFTDLKYRQQVLETSLSWPLNKNAAVRLFHRYENRATVDWHYDGISQQLIGQKLYLGSEPEDLKVNVVGVFLQYRM
ncbi:MAG TPA: MtrB/PioB family decaheme-associated outer membrane protein [Noviherbaspirillum sp.]|nr:MtrB/PioB family decaheme-associated outer membrane protein [Noviherbaspirillum sp.]